MSIEINPAKLLQTMIRFDTTNPPGNEYLVINWAKEILANAGIDSIILTKDPKRPNLIARLKGVGQSPPLLLQGHVDVVTTKGQNWKHPPFSGELIDDYVWGRGALDMKGAVAMMMTAVLKAHHDKTPLPGDIILCLLADEEAGGDFGAQYLVQEHPEIFNEVCYALGEAGGFSMNIAGKNFYPIMVAEKQICWTKIIIHGPAGHGSLIHRGGAMARLGKILNCLDKNRLPVHITPSVQMMFEGISSALSFPANMLIRQLLNPYFTDKLCGILGPPGKLFEPLFHNTVNATIVKGGDKVNVIPSEIVLELDGRLLPGHQPEQFLSELHTLLGNDIELQIVRHDPGPSEPDMGWFSTLANILKDSDPSGQPIPLVMTGVTDARHFSKLGIQTYGFTPMKLPPDFKFANLAHAANERIPIEALHFGTNAILEAMKLSGICN